MGGNGRESRLPPGPHGLLSMPKPLRLSTRHPPKQVPFERRQGSKSAIENDEADAARSDKSVERERKLVFIQTEGALQIAVRIRSALLEQSSHPDNHRHLLE